MYTLTTCKINSRWHHTVPLDEVKPGDYVEFEASGQRIRRVQKVHRGRKHEYVRVEPLPTITVLKNRKIELRQIRRVWRKGKLDGEI